jgi:electron transport complex protein RnfC
MKKFRGGVRLPRSRYIDAQPSFSTIAMPNKAIVPLAVSGCTESRCVVQVGEQLKQGQVIAESSNRHGIRIHAPVPGQVSHIGPLILPNQQVVTAVTIITGGSLFLDGIKNERDIDIFSPSRILTELADKGVVDHMSQGLPAHVKYDRQDPLPYLAINLLPDDGYGALQPMIAEQYTSSVLGGLKVLLRLLQPQVVVLCCTTDAQLVLAQFIEGVRQLFEKVEIMTLPLLYPYAYEPVLSHMVGQFFHVPNHQVEKMVSVVAPVTLVHIHQAILLGQPIIDQAIVVSGHAVNHRYYVWARMGTLLSDIINECHGIGRCARLIIGDSQTGIMVDHLDFPVDKSVQHVLALTVKEVKQSQTLECNNCGECERVCPIGLSPADLYQAIKNNQHDHAIKLFLQDCVNCGACSHVCPARLPLSDVLNSAKQNIEGQTHE